LLGGGVGVGWAGGAGGALQRGQRRGGAVGTAALPGLFYLTLNETHEDYQEAVALSVGCGVAAMLCALTVAVRDWRRDRAGNEGDGGCPPETSHSHTHAGQN
ncbi:MFS transporter, partial [Streptomyces olivaceus]